MRCLYSKEKPVYRYTTLYAYDTCDGEIILSRQQVKRAPIGKSWSIDDVDRYPDTRERYKVKVTKVYEDTDGLLLVESIDAKVTEMIWVECEERTETEK